MTRLTLISALCALYLILPASANAAAPANGGFAEVERQFVDLPMDARRLTGPLFWLHGDESKQKLQFFIDKIAEGGNGCFTAESRPHNDWLGPGWYRDLDICLQEAKKTGLRMWIFDEKWWPSQEVAGKVPPQYLAKVLTAESSTVDGPAKFTADGYSGEHLIAAIAGIDMGDGIDPAGLIDLKPFIANGKLDWNVPGGKWQVMKFSWETSKGKPLVDGASQDCVDWYIKTVYQPHYDQFPSDFGKTIQGFFYDEPETPGDWGTLMEPIFAERGIDYKKCLVAWKFKLAGEEQTAARYAYMDVFGDAWGRGMYGSMTSWCNEHGVRSIGHFMEHDWLYLNPHLCAFNMTNLLKYSDMGAFDNVFRQIRPDNRNPAMYQMPKLASSISHAYDKADDLTMCEIYGASGQALSYPEMKWVLDHHQVRGANFMIPHSINPKAPNDTDCPPYFYMGDAEPRWPLYRVWADYDNRLSLLLTGGSHVCPIAVLQSGISHHVGKAIAPELLTTSIQDAQFDCDWIPYEVFEGSGTIDGGSLSIHDERYRVLIVPPVEVIPYETLAKAKAFFDVGGIVIGYGFAPSRSASFGGDSRDIAALVEQIWGESLTGTGVCKINASGGRSYFLAEKPTPDEIEQALTDAGIRPDMEVVKGDTGGNIHVLHRIKEGRDVFLICNQNYTGAARRLTFRATAAGEPECWDPMRNERNSVAYKRTGPRTVEFDMTFEPYESVMMVFKPEKSKQPARIGPGVKQARAAVPLTRVKLPVKAVKKPADQTMGLEGLSWVWFPDKGDLSACPPGLRFFRKTFAIPQGRPIKQASLLATADNTMIVFVNGKQAGTSDDWHFPLKLDVAKLVKTGANAIAIKATNGGTGPNPAGLIGRLTIDYADGSRATVKIDDACRCAAAEQPGWTEVGFDDSAWAKAVRVCEFGSGPWGMLAAGITISPAKADPYRGKCALPAGLIPPGIIPGGMISGMRAYLEMDELPEDSASVMVNGNYAGGVIGKPFRVNVTSFLKPGANIVDILPRAPKSARLVFHPAK